MPIITLPLPLLALKNNVRTLTLGEQSMADQVFGKGTIDYNKVLIIKRMQFGTNDTRAMAPFGQIIYPSSKFRTDFSGASVSLIENLLLFMK